MAVGLEDDDDPRDICQICGELVCFDDMTHCTGCNKLCCDECSDWCAPEDDPDYGDYFCIDCQEAYREN